MSGRLDRRTVSERAIQAGKWIVMGRKWYTPDEFFREFGKGLSLHPDSWTLSDPMEALSKGRLKIKQMVESGEPADKILSALDRLYAFSHRVFHYFKKPI